ncbi:hypothetical protein ABEI22_17805 [Erwinia billingiae]|uniref:hypothetical protein n=1 Tax=Erwinia billingiae TaxID=182337 RepID=UPI00320A0DBB
MELFQSIAEAISLYRYIFWPLLGLMALVIIFIRWWEQVSYFFLNFFSSLPVVGFIARLSRNNEPRRAGTGGKFWYPAEEALCAKYWQHHKSFNLNADFYLRCVNYLNKVDERGRKPTGPLLWFCSVALVLLEAFIFALVLSPFIANNISANQAEFSAIVISVLIGVVLVPATHLMGAELHKNTLLKKIRYWYEDARHSGTAKGLSKNAHVSLEETRLDDGEPNYVQMHNRVSTNVHVKPQYWATAIALALILFFAVGAYFVRAATIDSMDTQAVNGTPFSQTTDAQSSPFDLPADAVADNAKADNQASKEIGNNRVFASKLTFIILSVIFVGVQLIGILIGIYRSFAGIESKMAAKYAGNFSGSEEFSAWHSMRRERVERDGQEKLSALQNRMMMKRTSSQSQQQNELPTFDDYVSGKIRDKARSEHELSEHLKSANYAQVEPVRAPQPPVATPRTLHVVDTAREAAVIDVPQASAVKEDEKERINALGDLIGLDEDDLALIAEDQGLSFEAVLKRQRVQQLLNKTRAKGEA